METDFCPNNHFRKEKEVAGGGHCRMLAKFSNTSMYMYLPLNPYTWKKPYTSKLKFSLCKFMAEALIIAYLWMEFRQNDHTNRNNFSQSKILSIKLNISTLQTSLSIQKMFCYHPNNSTMSSSAQLYN